MKLLNTIVAILLSVSAYSQDYIEYQKTTYFLNGEELSMKEMRSATRYNYAAKRNLVTNEGVFFQNGKEISMEQVMRLTRQYNVGKITLRKAIRAQANARPDMWPARLFRSQAVFGVGIGIGVVLAITGYILELDDIQGNEHETAYILALSTIPTSAVFAYKEASAKLQLTKAERLFKKVAYKINLAIEADSTPMQYSHN